MKLRAWKAVTLGLVAATMGAPVAAHAGGSEITDKAATYCRLRVHGGILAKYILLGSDKGRFGCPLGIEQAAADKGRMQQFDGGSIYWSRTTHAHAVSGRILELWQGNRGEAGCLGYPIDEEAPTPDGRGRVQHFEHGAIWHWNDGRVSAVC
ncbi:LGFP repeat-containing protein [Actinoplanes teichomyceticus]|uniref:LGFP repeat-containing protein n=1 Tax=Actinoplanes teichomyceticus TaxID=1867 RepID=A0A561WAZ2_ACTTI|nr:hypothetical protein [Actinoplanes teichomyceticus]TWG21034.1 LGFP repeat-containing protein [Actinoplanes teichomyceticus]GIF14854.1 hypothetical protein Ate01nite_48860 [Actinoplanes teichomyceticus]